MREPVSREIFRLLALIASALLLGVFAGRVTSILVLTLGAYLGWQIYWLAKLERWLASDRSAVPPDAPGLWGDIFHHLYRQYRRNRKRKQRIARLLRAFRDSTDAMPDGAVALNENWEIAWFNDAAVKLLGLVSPQDVGQRIGNLIRSPVFIRYLAAGDFREPVEIPSPLGTGHRLSLHVAPYGDNERLLLIRDITRMHRLEQMRREFVANASHELRSPLTVISGYLEALADDNDIPESWQQPVSEMRRQAARMSGIIEDLLELSRLETSEVQVNGDTVDVRGLLARIREEALLMGEGPRDVTLDIQTDCRLKGTEKEIYSAFSNLVFNAMRYTPSNGRVTLRWCLRDGKPCFAVQDTGIGIAREHIPRLTERFYRVDSGRVRAKGGTGLGLAIVKHVIQRHGAKLEIDSAPGKGSTFTCVFPAERRVDAAA